MHLQKRSRSVRPWYVKRPYGTESYPRIIERDCQIGADSSPTTAYEGVLPTAYSGIEAAKILSEDACS